MLSVMVTAMVTEGPTTTKDRRDRPVVTLRASAVDSEGKQFEASLIAFYFEVQTKLLKLKPGDEVSVVGHASLNTWDTPGGKRVGLNVIARRVLTHDDAGLHVTPHDRPLGPSPAPANVERG